MNIVRFHFNKPNELIAEGLTEAEAKAWCRRDDTHGPGFFDGYADAPEAEASVISGHDVEQGICSTLVIEPEHGSLMSCAGGVPVFFYKGG
jgi:hypothetical protein